MRKRKKCKKTQYKQKLKKNKQTTKYINEPIIQK